MQKNGVGSFLSSTVVQDKLFDDLRPLLARPQALPIEGCPGVRAQGDGGFPRLLDGEGGSHALGVPVSIDEVAGFLKGDGIDVFALAHGCDLAVSYVHPLGERGPAPPLTWTKNLRLTVL